MAHRTSGEHSGLLLRLERIAASRWFLVLKAAPFVALFLVINLGLHQLGWEPISLGPLITSLIAASVFLLGFLISGTLSDYKESERLPGEMSAIIETIADECRIIYKSKQAPAAKECLQHLHNLTGSLLLWFEKTERTKAIIGKVAGLSDFFLEFESVTQANFIARLKQEQNLLRRAVLRVDTIRDTAFVQAGYTIAQIAAGLLIIAFALTSLEPFYESLFLFGVVTFLLLYILFLIEDLDNPFSHYEHLGGSRVSLKLLYDTRERLEEDLRSLDATATKAYASEKKGWNG